MNRRIFPGDPGRLENRTPLFVLVVRCYEDHRVRLAPGWVSVGSSAADYHHSLMPLLGHEQLRHASVQLHVRRLITERV